MTAPARRTAAERAAGKRCGGQSKATPARLFHVRNFSEPRYGKTARTLFPGKEIRAVLLLGLVDKNATFNNTLNIRPLRFYRQEPEIHWRSTTRIRIAIYVLNLSTNLYI